MLSLILILILLNIVLFIVCNYNKNEINLATKSRKNGVIFKRKKSLLDGQQAISKNFKNVRKSLLIRKVMEDYVY